MGTNYYARFAECGDCGRYERVHLGKSSAGWKFLVHPPLRTIDTWEGTKQWLRAAYDPPAEVYDEYGLHHDTDEFIALVEATQDQRSHSHEYGLFTDPQGFDLDHGEFS